MTKKLSQDSSFPVDVVDKSKEATSNPVAYILNSNPINQLLIKSSDSSFDEKTGTATFIKKDTILQITNFTDSSIKELPHTTFYLLLALIWQFNTLGRKEPIIELPIKVYAKLRGLLDTKELRKQMRRDLELLGNYKITYQNHKNKFSKKKKKICDEDFFNINLSQGVGIYKKNIVFHLSNHFYNHFANAYPMFWYPDLLQLNPKTSSFFLGHYILSHYNMNFDKPNANIISVKCLLEACHTIPTKEKAYPHLLQRIIEPFANALDSLSSIGLQWHYCHSKGLSLTDSELEFFKYNIFIDCYIYLTLPNHPLTGTKRKTKPRKFKKTKSTT